MKRDFADDRLKGNGTLTVDPPRSSSMFLLSSGTFSQKIRKKGNGDELVRGDVMVTILPLR